MLKPSTIPFLQPNDVVDIIAPASRCEDATLPQITRLLASWGLRAHIPDNIFAPDILCANTDKERLHQLQQALYHSPSKAIWCIRGGYGSSRLLPAFTSMPKPEKKMLIGFSDITALHLYADKHWGWQTIHGPSARQAALQEISLSSLINLQQMLMEPQAVFHYTLEPMNAAAHAKQTIKGSITGGNLCLVQASIGTAWQVNAVNRVLFLEEINERGYRVDRMLEHLRQAAIFDHVQAIMLGDFLGGDEPNKKNFVQPVLQRFAESCAMPVVRLQGSGHGNDNYPLIFGKPIELQLGESPVLRMQC